jgi:flagellar assembly protein FliH
LSSESAAATVEAYSFRQLRAPAGATGADAADLLGGAHAQVESIREAARAQGEAEGRAQAQAAVRAEAEPALRALAGAAQALDQIRAELVDALERDSVELALLLAEQIVAGALDVEPKRLAGIAGQAIRRLADRREVILIANPADHELLSQALDQLRSELGGIDHCAVQADRRVPRGGVIARTEAGEIDATIRAQLSRAREIVAAELRPEPDPPLDGL